MELQLTAAECHLPYGITQYYLPPDTSKHLCQVGGSASVSMLSHSNTMP